MSKITPEDRNQRPIQTPITKAPDVRTPKAQDAGDVQTKTRQEQADEADKVADNKARLAKTTGKIPPDRSGLDTEEHAAAGKGAEGLREVRRSRAAKDEAGADEAKDTGIKDSDRLDAEAAAHLAEAQRMVIKNP